MNKFQLFSIFGKYLLSSMRSGQISYFEVSTVCNIFALFFPIWITCYPSMRTINFGKYLRLFQIEPIKTVEIRFVQIGKIGAKILHTVRIARKGYSSRVNYLIRGYSLLNFKDIWLNVSKMWLKFKAFFFIQQLTKSLTKNCI